MRRNKLLNNSPLPNNMHSLEELEIFCALRLTHMVTHVYNCSTLGAKAGRYKLKPNMHALVT